MDSMPCTVARSRCASSGPLHVRKGRTHWPGGLPVLVPLRGAVLPRSVQASPEVTSRHARRSEEYGKEDCQSWVSSVALGQPHADWTSLGLRPRVVSTHRTRLTPMAVLRGHGTGPVCPRTQAEPVAGRLPPGCRLDQSWRLTTCREDAPKSTQSEGGSSRRRDWSSRPNAHSAWSRGLGR
jgi:hypothetical protein